jgi:hypothetical protein
MPTRKGSEKEINMTDFYTGNCIKEAGNCIKEASKIIAGAIRDHGEANITAAKIQANATARAAGNHPIYDAEGEKLKQGYGSDGGL